MTLNTDNDGDAAALDRAFMALADPVRRAIVARLSRGEATVNELAAPFAISKQAVSKHIRVLEAAGLVTRSRDAQRRPVHLDLGALERLTAWIDRYRLLAEARYRRLDDLLAEMQESDPHGARARGARGQTPDARATGATGDDDTHEEDA
jgi:DNA-binding transcriptional ArsR family regulator